MGKRKKQTADVQQIYPGLVLLEDQSTIGFRIDQIQPSEFSFNATDFRVEVDDLELILQFGSNPRISKKKGPFDRAVELYMPLVSAFDCFFKNIYEKDSANGHPFIKTIESAVDESIREEMNNYKCERDPPQNSSEYFRNFNVNYASSIIFNGQVCIEFFEIPSTTVSYMHTKIVRPGERVRSILNVQTTAKLMYGLLVTLRKILEPMRNSIEGE